LLTFSRDCRSTISPDKKLRVFTAEEGGAQHFQRDYLTLGVAEMWNWFEDKLLRS
jgi:hypothetical protein